MNYPRPETTPGIFLEHFDLSPPSSNGMDGILDGLHYKIAMEAAGLAGWAFRSYSSRETPGTLDDFINKPLRRTRTLILYRDGVELGQAVVFNSVAGILAWGNELLGAAEGKVAVGNEMTIPPTRIETPNPRISTDPPPMIAPDSDPVPDLDPDLPQLRAELERHIASGAPLEIIYFGGGLPGARRTITPLRYCETRGRGHLIGLCHRSGIEKTFRLDRMHLPAPPLPGGNNDFRVLANCLGSAHLLEGMLAQIARLAKLPMENALAEHLAQRGDIESFFDEYVYGGYTLELRFTSTVIYLSLGYEAHDCESMHYEFTPEREPRLTPSIATNYSLYVHPSGSPCEISSCRRLSSHSCQAK